VTWLWWAAGYLVGGVGIALLIGRIVRDADEACAAPPEWDPWVEFDEVHERG
jgi:hypothetical protein